MRKIKIILLSLIGIITTFLVLLTFILSSYNNQDYQQLLIKTVDQLTDYTLSIQGTFELSRSFTPVLSASKIELRSKTDSRYIYIDNFKIQLALVPLLHNTLLINDLLLENVRAEIPSGEETKKSPEKQSSYLFVPIIEHAVLKNIQLIFDNEDQAHVIDSLVIEAENREAPLELRGTGMVRGDVFAIEGQLGPLADISLQDKPYPVNLRANWRQVQLSINGTIADPADGEGVGLIGNINIPEIADISTAIIPVKGHLHGSVNITGSVAEPMLAEMKLVLEDKQNILLQLTGATDNDALPQEKTNLHLSGFIHDVALLKWLMPDDTPSFQRFNFATDISKGVEDYILQNININLSGEQGLEIDLTGNSHFILEQQAFKSLALQAEISSKDTATVKPYLGNILPEMGAVKGSAKITAQDQSFILSNINLLAGVGEKIQLTAKGQVGPLSMGHSDAMEIALALKLKAEKSSELSSLLNIKHPEIGPVAMSASLNGSADKLKLQGVKLRAGNPSTLSLQADGWIAWDKLASDSPQQTTDFTIRTHTPSIKEAAYLYGEYLPDFGATKASMRIHGKGMVLKGDDMAMQIGTKDSLLLKVQGKVAQIFMTDLFYKGISLTANLSAKSTSQLSKLLENNEIPDIGLLSGKFMIKGDSNTLRIPQLTLSAGRKKQLMLSASGKVAEIPLRTQAPASGVDIALAVTAPNTTDLSVALGTEVPDLGRLEIKGRLMDYKGVFAIKELIMTAGNQNQTAVSINGSIEDVLSKNSLQMRLMFDEKTLLKLFDLHPLPELGKLKGSVLLSNAGGSFAIKDLKLESENSALINVNINTAVSNDVSKTDDFRLNADISIENPTLFGKLFSADLSGISLISASGLISGNKDRVTFKGNSFVGRTRFNSELVFSLLNKKVKISGIINSPNLFVEDFGLSAAQTQTTKAEKAVLFSRAPLPLQSLHKVDLDLQLRIYKITGIKYKLDRVNIDLLLQNGKLTANPVKFIFSEGHILMNIDIDAKEKPEWSLNIHTDNMQLSKLFGQQASSAPIEGKLDFVVDTTTVGTSAHEIVANLNGEVGFTLENGGVTRGLVELIFL
ncbi:MAG: AsmA family protein, partial [Methyloprofundus sp.]|nr:AsmA family protein [Methyloprofundus sp.]